MPNDRSDNPEECIVALDALQCSAAECDAGYSEWEKQYREFLSMADMQQSRIADWNEYAAAFVMLHDCWEEQLYACHSRFDVYQFRHVKYEKQCNEWYKKLGVVSYGLAVLRQQQDVWHDQQSEYAQQLAVRKLGDEFFEPAHSMQQNKDFPLQYIDTQIRELKEALQFRANFVIEYAQLYGSGMNLQNDLKCLQRDLSVLEVEYSEVLIELKHLCRKYTQQQVGYGDLVREIKHLHRTYRQWQVSYDDLAGNLKQLYCQQDRLQYKCSELAAKSKQLCSMHVKKDIAPKGLGSKAAELDVWTEELYNKKNLMCKESTRLARTGMYLDKIVVEECKKLQEYAGNAPSFHPNPNKPCTTQPQSFQREPELDQATANTHDARDLPSSNLASCLSHPAVEHTAELSSMNL